MGRNSALALTARQSQLLIFLGVPLVFLHCIDYVVELTPPSQSHRDLDNVDLFSGKGAVHRAFIKEELLSKPFDKETHGLSGDICDTQGFLKAIQLCLRLRVGALIHAGPPCGSFVFINRWTSGRSAQKPMGNQRQYVKEANEIACRMVLLLVLCFVRCVVNLIEQPSSTLMLAFPYVRWLAKVISLFFPWLETRFHMASYGHKNMKPTVCFGCAPWSYRLHKKITPATRKRVRKSKGVVKKYQDAAGKKRVCGNPLLLKRSQIYPSRYGHAVCKHHKAWMEDASKVKVLKETLYPPCGGLDDATLKKVPKAPYRWRHACLSKLQAFLVAEMAAGRFHPVLSGGLDGP